ncbi:hypothetical protein CRG98_005959 [Punica granatum]|uniref:RNase H type-1 domain-containing protein n=1 Tax=Punica granatum TaxID=22663 RepID=A0A2I0KZ16_PUNGR|nr:hypothetical protein CRG98_005959 [Punica granatum]
MSGSDQGPLISHLMFTDDLLPFAQPSEVQLIEICAVLDQFCAASGQRGQSSKTVAFFSRNVELARTPIEKTQPTSISCNRDLQKLLFDAPPFLMPQLLCVPGSVSNGLNPRAGFLKLNTDEASRGNASLAGAGGIICDENGHWVIGFMMSISIGIASSKMAELQGIVAGLKHAWELGCRTHF